MSALQESTRRRQLSARPLAHKYDDSLVGCRVRVYWELDEAWYAGEVRQFIATTGHHVVCYDDGDQRNEGLNDPTLRWEKEPTSSAPPAKQKAKQQSRLGQVIGDDTLPEGWERKRYDTRHGSWYYRYFHTASGAQVYSRAEAWSQHRARERSEARNAQMRAAPSMLVPPWGGGTRGAEGWGDAAAGHDGLVDDADAGEEPEVEEVEEVEEEEVEEEEEEEVVFTQSRGSAQHATRATPTQTTVR